MALFDYVDMDPNSIQFASPEKSPSKRPEPELVLECLPHMVLQCATDGNTVFVNSKVSSSPKS